MHRSISLCGPFQMMYCDVFGWSPGISASGSNLRHHMQLKRAKNPVTKKQKVGRRASRKGRLAVLEKHFNNLLILMFHKINKLLWALWVVNSTYCTAQIKSCLLDMVRSFWFSPLLLEGRIFVYLLNVITCFGWVFSVFLFLYFHLTTGAGLSWGFGFLIYTLVRSFYNPWEHWIIILSQLHYMPT